MISKALSILSTVVVLTTSAFAAEDTIKIGITGPFTGGSASMGTSLRDGAKLAIKEINAKGGVTVGEKKFKLVAIERDDEAKNERGALIANEFAGIEGLIAIIGTSNTGVALAEDKILLDSKKPIIRIITGATGTTIPKQWADSGVKDLYLFRVSANDAVQTELIVDEAVKLGVKKVAIIHDTSNYGVAGHDDLVKNLTKYPDIKLVATERFNVGDKDMTPQVAKMKDNGAEAVLIVGIGPELARVTAAMKKLSFNVPLVGTWTLSMSSFLDNAGKDANGVRVVQIFIEEPYSKKAEKFINDFHAEYKVNKMSSPMSAVQAHDAIKILVAGIEQAGSLDPAKIKDALEDLKKPVDGVIAVFTKPFQKWDPKILDSHDALKKKFFIIATIKDGKVIFSSNEDREKLRQISEGKN